MTSAATDSTWGDGQRPGSGSQYETDEGTVVPTHDHEAATHGDTEVSEDLTEGAQRARDTTFDEPIELEHLELSTPDPLDTAARYETDEGPVVPTHDHEAATHGDTEVAEDLTEDGVPGEAGRPG